MTRRGKPYGCHGWFKEGLERGGIAAWKKLAEHYAEKRCETKEIEVKIIHQTEVTHRIAAKHK